MGRRRTVGVNSEEGVSFLSQQNLDELGPCDCRASINYSPTNE